MPSRPTAPARLALRIPEEPSANQPLEVVGCLDVLARVAARRDEEAEAPYLRAPSLREEVSPGGHPDPDEVMEHYAKRLRETGRGTEAETMRRRAETIRARFDRENPAR